MRKPKQFTKDQKLAAMARLASASKGSVGGVGAQGITLVALNEVYEGVHQHRLYEVYPVTILKEMVLQGTGTAFEYGPAFIPAASLEATAPLWSGVPVLVNHPKWGLGNEQYVINEDGLGFLFNPWYDSRDNELYAELWIDKEVAEQNSRWVDIKAQAEDGTLELSTGYLLLSNQEKDGSFEGVPYKSVHEGIIPLHLAVLPDTTGACSNAAGCGINEAGGDPSKKRSLAEVLSGVLETYGLNKILSSSGEAAALNSQQKEANAMSEATKNLLAALESAGFSNEQATKLVGTCDCEDLQVFATNQIATLVASAGKVAGLESKLSTATAKLQEFTDQEEAKEGKLRAGYLTSLGLSDEDADTKATPTAFLRTLSIKAGYVPEGEVSETEAAKIAELTTTPADKVEVTLEAADSTPKRTGA